MLLQNLRLALQSLKSNKTRSLLTTLGIVVGVGSVIVVASLGEGFKNQIKGQVKKFGDNLITIQPGSLVNRTTDGSINSLNFSNALPLLSSSNLTENDLQKVAAVPSISTSAPISVLSGIASYENKQLTNGLIIGTNESLPVLLNQKVAFGEFFTKDEYDKHVVVIGSKVADELYGEEAPIGKQMTIRGQVFNIRAVIAPHDGSMFGASIDMNHSIFIPFPVAKSLNDGNVQIAKILVLPKTDTTVAKASSELSQALTAAHGGQKDFTVLTQEESVQVAGSVIGLATGFIAAIASISLIVGGIGIMNIMLLSVSERTKEIGIRKSVGATSRQILNQFLLESIVLSLIGGIIALILNGIIIMSVRYFTIYKPVITLPMVGLAFLTCIGVGILFGLVPAVRAARKDPIQALRGY